ncbi:MAG: beta-lactamase family protein [Thermoleophilaceae bacterium]|nr:beta-lactamase family protein [Thermoleophilaceae bacterium]
MPSLGKGVGLALVVLAISASAASAQAAAPAQRADRALDAALERLTAMRGGPPGAAAVVQRRQARRLHVAGTANLRTGRRWRAQDHMRLASVTKAYSGAVALALVTRGVLRLDDTIGERLSDLPAAWAPVTLRQLLNHTSGLPNYTASMGFLAQLQANPHGFLSPRQLIDFVADEPLVFPPGSEYAYSNTDNVVVALMAEAATGRAYERELQARVFGPLDLGRTSLPSGFRLPRPFVHGYEVEPPRRPEDISTALSMSGVWASGGMVSTPIELNRFIRAYAGGRLFGPGPRAQQLRFVEGSSEPPGPGINSAGLAIFRYRTRCGTVYGHTGNFPGYTQFAAATRNGRRSATVSVNTQLSPDAGSPAVFRALRRVDALAVCAALARRR